MTSTTSPLDTLLSSLLSAKSINDQNVILAKLPSLVKDLALSKDVVVEALKKIICGTEDDTDNFINPNSRLLYYKCLCVLKYESEIVSVYGDKDADRFTLEYVSKNLCRFVSGEKILGLLQQEINDFSVNLLASPVYRSLVIKRFRKRHPEHLSALFESSWQYDKTGSEALHLLLHAPEDSDLHRNLVSILKQKLFKGNRDVTSSGALYPHLRDFLVKRHPMVIIQLTGEMLKDARDQFDSKSDYTNRIMPIFGNDWIEHLLRGRNMNSHAPSDAVLAYLDLIEEYAPRRESDGLILFPRGICSNSRFLSLNNMKLHDKSLDLIVKNMNGLGQVYEYYFERETAFSPSFSSHRMPARSLIRYFTAALRKAPINYVSLWSQLLCHLTLFCQEKEKSFVIDSLEKELQSVLRGGTVESHLGQISDSVPTEWIYGLPLKKRSALAVKLLERTRKNVEVLTPPVELSFLILQIPSDQLYSEMIALVKGCRDNSLRPGMYRDLFSHYIMNYTSEEDSATHKESSPAARVLPFLLSALANEPNDTQILLLNAGCITGADTSTYHAAGYALTSDSVLDFFKEIVQMIAIAKDRSTSNMQSAMRYLLNMYIPLFSSLPKSVISQERYHRSILKLFSMMDILLEKKVSLSSCITSVKSSLASVQAFAALLCEHMADMIRSFFTNRKFKEVKQFISTIWTLNSRNTQKMLSIPLMRELIEGILSEPVYSQFLEDDTDMTFFVDIWISEKKRARIPQLLDLDPSIVAVKSIQEYLFKNMQDKLGQYLQFERVLTVNDFKQIAKRSRYAFISGSAKFFFDANIILNLATQRLGGSLREQCTKALISFIRDPDNANQLYKMKLYLRALITMHHEDEKAASYHALESELKSGGDAALCELFLLADLISGHPSGAFERLLDEITKENVALVSTNLFKALHYFPGSNWTDIVVKRLANTTEKTPVTVKKTLVHLLAMSRDENILSGPIYKLWSDAKLHKDVKCEIVGQMEYFLPFDMPVAWKILEEASLHPHIDVVTKLFELMVNAEKDRVRLAQIQTRSLDHSDREIRLVAWRCINIQYVNSEFYAQRLADALVDFEVSNHNLFEAIAQRMTSMTANIVTADEKSLQQLLELVVSRAIKRLEEKREDLRRINEENSPGEEENWDLPVRKRISMFMQSLCGSSVPLITKQSFFKELSDSVTSIDDSLQTEIWKRTIKAMSLSDSHHIVSTLLDVKTQIESVFSQENQVEEKTFALHQMVHDVEKHLRSQYLSEEVKNAAMELISRAQETGELFVLLLGLKILPLLRPGTCTFSPSEVEQINSCRKHSSRQIRSLARQIIILVPSKE